MKLAEARKLIRDLPSGLKRHIERSCKLGRALARTHGVSPHKVALAILLHDTAREIPETEMIELAEGFGLDITEYDLQIPLLLHGPVGAELLKRDRGLEDADVLEAIACHTTGKPGMGKFSQVVFLADKLESGKIRESPELGEVLRLAYEKLDGAMLAYLRWQKESLKKTGLDMHPLGRKTMEHFEKLSAVSKRQTVDKSRVESPGRESRNKQQTAGGKL